jgi:hypothetical protein
VSTLIRSLVESTASCALSDASSALSDATSAFKEAFSWLIFDIAASVFDTLVVKSVSVASVVSE